MPRLRAAREAVDEEFSLMQDADRIYELFEAIEISHALDELDYLWLEEPISDHNLTLLKSLARTLRIGITGLELDLDWDWIESHAVDQTSSSHCI